MKKLSIVIPCFNEAKNIPLILGHFARILKRFDIEVILVNNGSLDESQQILDYVLPAFPFARTVHVEKNQGYGFGILAGLRAATGEYLSWTHADMQTDPHDVIKALEMVEQLGNPTNIYIKGNRKGRSALDLFFTVGMSCFETMYLGKRLWDINAQPNLFHKSFFAQWHNPPHDFALDLYALYLAHQLNLKIVRFDVTFPPRVHGQSSWNTGLFSKWKLTKRTMLFSRALKKELE
ncbi:glycosyltransferase family 2 protein [Candidatus Babeliales bacterium]|nr:glycosyltransferase family 2 protein [Candidatus Babeliales bacterium]